MAAVDVTGLVRGIGDQAGPVLAIATACLLVFVVIRAFKWLKLAIGGSGRGGVMTQAESDQFWVNHYAAEMDQAGFDRKYAAGEAVAGVDFVDAPGESSNIVFPPGGGRPMPRMTEEESKLWQGVTFHG